MKWASSTSQNLVDHRRGFEQLVRCACMHAVPESYVCGSLKMRGLVHTAVGDDACPVQDDDGPLAWKNMETGEVGGPKGSLRGAEPTRFGDWEQNG